MEHIKRVRIMRELGQAVKIARRQRKWTQDELAKRSGVWQETISKIERGARGTRVQTFLRLCLALNLELIVTKRGEATPQELDEVFGHAQEQ